MVDIISEKERARKVIDWLSRQGPAEWHAIAEAWDWDDDCAPLAWIVQQPTCDRATAATIFWASEPDYFFSEDGHGDIADMDEDIVNRWNAGFYTSARFRFATDELNDYISETLDRIEDIPDSIAEPIDGGEDYPSYARGLPAEIARTEEPSPEDEEGEEELEAGDEAYTEEGEPTYAGLSLRRAEHDEPESHVPESCEPEQHELEQDEVAQSIPRHFEPQHVERQPAEPRHFEPQHPEGSPDARVRASLELLRAKLEPTEPEAAYGEAARDEPMPDEALAGEPADQRPVAEPLYAPVAAEPEYEQPFHGETARVERSQAAPPLDANGPLEVLDLVDPAPASMPDVIAHDAMASDLPAPSPAAAMDMHAVRAKMQAAAERRESLFARMRTLWGG